MDRISWSTGLTTGGAGTSTATGYSPVVRGVIHAVYVDYVGGPPAGTTDFTLSDEADPASELIVNLANQATDIKLYPRRIVEMNDGTDVLYAAGEEVHEKFAVHGRLEATIAQANDNDSVTVTVWFSAV
jgi:hypothetical protein